MALALAGGAGEAAEDGILGADPCVDRVTSGRRLTFSGEVALRSSEILLGFLRKFAERRAEEHVSKPDSDMTARPIR